MLLCFVQRDKLAALHAGCAAASSASTPRAHLHHAVVRLLVDVQQQVAAIVQQVQAAAVQHLAAQHQRLRQRAARRHRAGALQRTHTDKAAAAACTVREAGQVCAGWPCTQPAAACTASPAATQAYQQRVHGKEARVQQAHDASAAAAHDGGQRERALVCAHVWPQQRRLVQRQAVERQQLERLWQDQLHLVGQMRRGGWSMAAAAAAAAWSKAAGDGRGCWHSAWHNVGRSAGAGALCAARRGAPSCCWLRSTCGRPRALR